MGCGCCKGGSGAWIAIFAGVGAAIGATALNKSTAKSSNANEAAVQAPALEQVAAMGEDMREDYVLGYTMNGIDDASVDLAQYKGKVVLLVNTASKCGLTKQYAGLEELYQAHKDAGLVILGFPANNFGGQEPGTNKEIQSFCTDKFNVTFPMFSKISVTGDDAHPLYVQLAKLSEAPTWNFTKYLVDREGNFVARFAPQTTPDNAELTAKIESLLEAAAPVPQ